jgi:short/branched chain acyl-CoA dehydrogenase
MDFLLSDDHGAIQELVRDFARNEIAPVAEELDREKRFPYEIVGKLGELGLMGIPFPEEHGGGGGDTLAYALAVEELARVDSSVAITLCAHTSLGTQPIAPSAPTSSASAGCRTCAAVAGSARSA